MSEEKKAVRKLSPEEAVALYKKAKNCLKLLKIRTSQYIEPFFRKFVFTISGISTEGLESIFTCDIGTAVCQAKESSGFRYEGLDYIDIYSENAEWEVYELAGVSMPDMYGAINFASCIIEETGYGDWSILDVCDRIDEMYEGLRSESDQIREEIDSFDAYAEERQADFVSLTEVESICYAKLFSDAIREVQQGVAIEETYLSAFYDCVCVLDSSYSYRKEDFVENLDALLIKFYCGGGMPFSVPGNTELNEKGIPVQIYERGCVAVENYSYPHIGELYRMLYQLPDTEDVEAFRWACEVMSSGKYLYGFPVLDKLNCAVPDDEGGVLFQSCRAEGCTSSSEISVFAGVSIAEVVAPLVIHALADDLIAKYVEKAA